MLPTIRLEIERWKWNEHYLIWVSNKGRFKDGNKKDVPIMINDSGYVSVKVFNGDKPIEAHRVVMITWKPIEGYKHLTVDHLDHNKRNNAVSNLEWVTYKENLKRASKDLETNNRKFYCVELNKEFTKEELYDFVMTLGCVKNNPTAHGLCPIRVAKLVTKAVNSNKLKYGYTWEIKF
jgi:hypothetical protein